MLVGSKCSEDTFLKNLIEKTNFVTDYLEECVT